MRIRRIPVPAEYEHAPGHRDIAEAAFLKALRREKGRGPAVQPAPRPEGRAAIRPPASTPRAQGQSYGRAFAQISGADYDRASNYARAIRSGAREAQQRDTEARDMAQDPDALRALGFYGRDDDED